MAKNKWKKKYKKLSMANQFEAVYTEIYELRRSLNEEIENIRDDMKSLEERFCRKNMDSDAFFNERINEEVRNINDTIKDKHREYYDTIYRVQRKCDERIDNISKAIPTPKPVCCCDN